MLGRQLLQTEVSDWLGPMLLRNPQDACKSNKSCLLATQKLLVVSEKLPSCNPKVALRRWEAAFFGVSCARGSTSTQASWQDTHQQNRIIGLPVVCFADFCFEWLSCTANTLTRHEPESSKIVLIPSEPWRCQQSRPKRQYPFAYQRHGKRFPDIITEQWSVWWQEMLRKSESNLTLRQCNQASSVFPYATVYCTDKW